MTDTPHICFTVDTTSYLRNLDREDLRGVHIAVHYQAPPKKNDDGSTSMSLNIPVLITSLYLQERQSVADKVAALLNQHWDDEEGTPEPQCAACGKSATEHLGEGDCAQFIASAELAAIRKENAELKAQAERICSTIDVHHENFEQLYERATAILRNTPESDSGTTIALVNFARFVAGLTHPEAEKR